MLRRERDRLPDKLGDRVRYLLYQKYRAYKDTFDSPQGSVVLRDLMELIQPSQPTPARGTGSQQALEMARNDGMRTVWLHIQTRLALTPEEIERQAAKYGEPEYE